MNILMLGWELPPYNSGGLGVACYQMCRQMAKRKIPIDFVLPHQPVEQPDFMRVHGALPVSALTFYKNGYGAYGNYCYPCQSAACEHAMPTTLRGQQRCYIKFVEQLVQQQRYDVIHAHDWLTFEAGLRAKQLTGKPLIAHVHATEFDRAGLRDGNNLIHQIEYSTLLMADSIVAVSNLTKNIIISRYDIPADKIYVVHNGLDMADMALDHLDTQNAYRYLEQMKNLGYKVVVSLGRLSIQKGITHLLEAAQKALFYNKKIIFLVVGDGDMRDELIHRTAELGISDNVIFTGFLRGKQWRDAYAIGDMFVMPSVSEPFGLSALEAAAYGNAVLLSKQCGVGEVLHNTMQFDVWDTDKLANAIIALADHKSMHKMLSDRAKQEVASLTWHKAAEKFENMYKYHMGHIAKVPA